MPRLGSLVGLLLLTAAGPASAGFVDGNDLQAWCAERRNEAVCLATFSVQWTNYTRSPPFRSGRATSACQTARREARSLQQ